MHSIEFISEYTNTAQYNFVINYLNYKTKGFFIELGASDGVEYSNTYKLEKEYDWDGILIEPITTFFDEINKYRTCSYILNECISEKNEIIEFTSIEGYSKMLSGISKEYPEEHLSRIGRETESMNQKIHKQMINTKTLFDIIKDCNIKTIDYLSIDVEGAELSVLKGLQMENHNIRPKIIGCENNYKTDEVEKYLNLIGYTKIHTAAADDMYAIVT